MEDILHMDYQAECWSFLYVILIDLILVSIRFFLVYIRFLSLFLFIVLFDIVKNLMYNLLSFIDRR